MDITLKTDIEATAGTSATDFTQMILTNIQNNSAAGPAPDSTGIYIGVPLYDISDSTMFVNYYFWVFNGGTAGPTLDIKCCDPAQDCTLEAHYTIVLNTSVVFVAKSRQAVKVIMAKSTTAGQILLNIGSGVYFKLLF